ncbi:unnamed protein product [Calypogeia fissa]
MSASGLTVGTPFLQLGSALPNANLVVRQDLRSGWVLGNGFPRVIAAGGVTQTAASRAAPRRRSTYLARAAAQVQEGETSNRPTAGVEVYKPASYDVLVSDAANAVMYALEDGKQRLEVDFPPLPSSVSGYKGSSDEFIDANVQLAFALARKLNELKGWSAKIVFPDGPEKRRALRVFKSALELTQCVIFGSLEDLPADVRGAARDLLGQIKGFFDFDFEEDTSGEDTFVPDVYLVIGATTNELPNVKEYIDYFAKDRPVVLFNLETDTLRADLGLFGFPSKDVHYKFLSQFQPVFYIRTRDYSKSVPVAPFLLNYSGALFRQYPGSWQVMLKQGDGSYVCVAESAQRFTLFQTKEELLTSIGLQEVEGSTMAFLRSGYKTSTWWEDDLELEESSDWRT